MQCYTQEIKDGEELLDEVTVVKSPSQEDAQQWFEGEFVVKSVEKKNTYKLVIWAVFIVFSKNIWEYCNLLFDLSVHHGKQLFWTVRKHKNYKLRK